MSESDFDQYEVFIAGKYVKTIKEVGPWEAWVRGFRMQYHHPDSCKFGRVYVRILGEKEMITY